MIDIVAVLLTPRVAPSGLAASSMTMEILNTEEYGSYLMSSMISTVNIVSWSLAESNIISDVVTLKSAATTIISDDTSISYVSISLPVAVTNFEMMCILKLVEKALEATILIFNLLPSVML